MKILLDSCFEPLSTMNEFTIKPAYEARRAGRSWLNTQNAYTDDLFQYKTFLNILEIEEPDVVLDDLQNFGACFTEGISVRTRQKFATSTGYRRFGTAVRYHRFRIHKGLASAVSLSELSSVGGYQNGILRADPDSPYAGMPKDIEPSDKMHPFLDGEWEKVFDRLGPASTSCVTSSRRDRLASELSMISGMRIDEVCSLTVLQITNLARHVDPAQPSKLIRLWITKTKGLKPGYVFLPSFLVARLLEYISGERQIAVDRANLVRGDHEPTTMLFVNDVRSNHITAGNPLTTDTLSRAFSNACIAAGLYHLEECYVLDEAGEPIVSANGANLSEMKVVADHTFHDLRHTFAMLTYMDMAKSGREDPWKFVSSRLRHASIITTLRSYLRWLDRGEQFLSNSLMDTYRRIDTVGGSA
ncbi:tyrosine-type recombinase/integrase [Rhizobium bangladeshense]|uniref:tyrosine-type recombinase/integrase n=1 Tax=Rhizobium bangladeshense TaxID=1138189 RepID=UPI001C9279DC|nr:site-specific integrase [Rhizobium bangladeshense]MBY3613519.1 site-specific integrase [Rhizobium bangladeshense]